MSLFNFSGFYDFYGKRTTNLRLKIKIDGFVIISLNN